MTTATNNGSTQRKQLSDQLDRLDHMLDGLSEALNESVADAVRGVISLAVSEAVHAAVTEVLSSPALLRAALERHAPTATVSVPPTPEKPAMKEKVANIGKRLYAKVKQTATLARKKLTEAVKQVTKIASHVPTLLKAVARAAWAFRKLCVVAVGVGVACATACYFGGQVFSSVSNGVSGATITLSAMTLPVRRMFSGGKS